MPGKPIDCGITEPAPKGQNAIAPESRDGRVPGEAGTENPRQQRRG